MNAVILLSAAVASEGWSNLTALGALIVCMVWGVTRGIPGMLQKFVEESEKQRDTFSQDLDQQRNDFRDELKEYREHSRVLAESGHAAVQKLAGSINDLRTDLKAVQGSEHSVEAG